MGNIFENISEFYRAHRRGIRTACFATGVACTLATPVVASIATDRVKKKVATSGAKTKKEIWDIAKKEPLVWVTVATTAGSVGFGGAAYAMGNKIIKLGDETASKLADSIATTNDVIKSLPEKDQTKIQKAIIDKKYESFSENPSVYCGEYIETGYGDVRFIDGWTNTSFKSSLEHINAVVNELNEKMNSGYNVTVANWCTANGFPSRELDYDYVFRSNIRLVKDNDHFYTYDGHGNPVGWVEFDEEPRHREPGETLALI